MDTPSSARNMHLDELDKYGFIGYIPNTDLMDSGLDYDQMFIIRDQLCDGTHWHVRTAPANTGVDPYFPVNQAALSLAAEQDKIRVTMRTMTPHFRTCQSRLDGGIWHSPTESMLWTLPTGQNRLEVRTLNSFDVPGPVSVIEIGL